MSGPELSGRVALVTGSARRIGRQTALALAAAGVGVIVHYSSSEEEAEKTANDIRTLGPPAWTLRADLTDADELSGLVGRALELAGRLDILVNNASTFPAASLDDLDYTGFASSMQVNAWAPFVLSREFARVVDRGSIVNLLDSRTEGFDWNHIGYILAKHVLSELTRMMAVKYAPNVTVNGIGPGLVLPPEGRDDSYLDALADTVPLRRHGDPDDVADAVVFLVKSDFITGQVIYVDGGRHVYEYVQGVREGR